MKKKLWMTFGPLLVAFAVFLFVLFGPSSLFSKVSSETVEKSATSMNESVIQGLDIQKKLYKKETIYQFMVLQSFPASTHFILA